MKHRLYHYATRLLLERVSWLCEEKWQQGFGDGTTELVFSHRRNLSYDDLKRYIDRLKTQGTEINWSAIDSSRVKPLPHRTRKGLWVADCVASSFYQGLEVNRQLGIAEPRYATALGPVVWGHRNIRAGNGFKIFPQEALRTLDYDGQHEWVKRFGIRA